MINHGYLGFNWLTGYTLGPKLSQNYLHVGGQQAYPPKIAFPLSQHIGYDQAWELLGSISH